jgi:hypothetical protein
MSGLKTKKMSLRGPVLATLVYYDVLDYPLTSFEVFKYLVNPARINESANPVGEIELLSVIKELDSLVKAKIISELNGYYFLPGRQEIYTGRINREKIAAKKWKKLIRISNWLQVAPFVRGLFVSGSMAIDNPEHHSDFDVLVIIRSGRLYLGRMFISLIPSIIGARRKHYDRVAPDKFCFNHYITDKDMAIKHESIYNAQSYASLRPLFIDKKVFDEFYRANTWINRYVYNFKPSGPLIRRNNPPILFLRTIRIILEKILDNKLGNKFEKMARSYQQKRIITNPETYKPGGRVVFNDNELEFHPRSFEKTLIKEYNEGLLKLGIFSRIKEKDSGLLAYQLSPIDV